MADGLNFADVFKHAPLAKDISVYTASLLSLILAGLLQAHDPVVSPPLLENAAEVRPADPAPDPEGRWFARVGTVAALYNSSAAFSLDGAVIPGATAHASDNVTLTFDLGYEVSDHFAVMLMGGIPPELSLTGEGSVSSLGELGSVRYGPLFLTGVYRLPEWQGFRPYVGGGVVRAIMLDSHDGAVTDLKVHDSWGGAFQAGVEYELANGSALFVDYKRVWLDVDAEGSLMGAPVRARVTLDPDLISVGVKFRFD